MQKLLLSMVGARLLGHGRMFELTVGTICALYGTMILFHSDTLWDSQATRDLSYFMFGRVIAAPFLLKAALTGYGLAGNIYGWRYSRSLRFYGALVGCCVWAFLETKFVLVGVPFTFGSICTMVFFLGSLRVIIMTSLDLPIPGAPGIR